MKKLVVIGFDGASPALIDEYAHSGLIPNLNKIVEQGIFAKLHSVIPTISTTAWSSFSTGKNPGKHNVFGFLKQEDNVQKILNSTDRKSASVWHYLSEAGKRVAVINMPLTFPVDKINGIMVSGMLTPNERVQFTYPSEFQKELRGAVPNYEIDITETLWAANRKKYLEKVLELTRKKEKLALYLLRKYNWDAFVFIITELDRLQHFFWDPKGQKDHNAAIQDYYILLDEIVGNIMGVAGPEADYLIVSDHGFGPVNKFIHINSILRDHSYLTPSSSGTYNQSKQMALVRTMSRLAMKSGMNLETVKKMLPSRLVQQVTISMSRLDFDESRTEAFFSAALGEGVIIHHEDSSRREAIRNEVVRLLTSLRDPESGENVIEKVFKREELYAGEYVANAPDLVVLLKDGYYSSADLTPKNQWFSKPSAKTVSGDHLMDGVFMAFGNTFESKKGFRRLEIVDVMPTILHYFELPIPEDLDGCVAFDIFRFPLSDRNSAKKQSVKSVEASSVEAMSKEDEKVIIEQLKSLGYV